MLRNEKGTLVWSYVMHIQALTNVYYIYTLIDFIDASLCCCELAWADLL